MKMSWASRTTGLDLNGNIVAAHIFMVLPG